MARHDKHDEKKGPRDTLSEIPVGQIPPLLRGLTTAITELERTLVTRRAGILEDFNQLFALLTEVKRESLKVIAVVRRPEEPEP